MITLILGSCLHGKAQSLEVMTGVERIFADVQWLKPLGTNPKWTVFTRARGTVNYDNQTDLFMWSYFNYTTSYGLGGTVLGSITSRGAGADAGIHFFKANSNFMVFALASVEVDNDLGYYWFSIMRYTPRLTEKWRLYTSLELYSLFDRGAHVASVQRLRLGASRNQRQFGFGYNTDGLGSNYDVSVRNPGIFIRKTF